MGEIEALGSALWAALRALQRGLDPARATIPTVIVELQDGTRFEVFRAEPVEAPMEAWRVRAFTDGTAVRLAVILGTRDGRAMVTEKVEPEAQAAVLGGIVARVEPSERSLADLSQAIADAVRERLGEPPPHE